MLRQTLLEADKLFNKFDLSTVVVYPSADNHCCISCHTDDDLVYLYIKNKNEGYTEKEFALRSWSSIHSIIGASSDNEALNIKVMNDSSNYPNLFKIKMGRISMTYYLQNYTFLSNQQELLDNYKNKKFELNRLTQGNAENLDETLVKDVLKLSSLVNEKTFKIKSLDLENNVIYFGNEEQSVDNGNISIGNIGGQAVWKPEINFSVDYFSAMFRALSDENIKIKITPQQIIMFAETEDCVKVGILRGKNV